MKTHTLYGAILGFLITIIVVMIVVVSTREDIQFSIAPIERTLAVLTILLGTLTGAVIGASTSKAFYAKIVSSDKHK